MKAIGAPQYFPPSDPNCLVEFEAPMPVAGARDLLVKVLAVAVNPVDTKIRKTLGAVALESPRVLGFDAAGIVEAVGAEVSGFAVGDEVFYSGDVTRAGSNAEFQVVDARLVAKKPKSWTFAEAAAVPLVGLTAWELLLERMGVIPFEHDPDNPPDFVNNGSNAVIWTNQFGKPLLIINGAGGVGSAMIAIARLFRLTVVTTASRPETRAWCESLGAHHVVNHREPLRPQVEALGFSEFPYIANLYDTEAYWETTADLLAPLGTLGLVVDSPNPLPIGNPFRLKSPRIAWEYMAARSMFQTPDMHRQGEILAEIAGLCDQGAFPKIATRVFDKISAANLREAHAAMESGTAHGKWVLSNW